MIIRPFAPPDTESVVDLWQVNQLTRPWNDPRLDIQRKREVQSEWFLVAIDEAHAGSTTVIGSLMGGYDGHRGWMNYLAVRPDHQGRGVGSSLVAHLEAQLKAAGCPKLNLQIRADNEGVQAFYRKLGYTNDPVLSMGKRLIADA